MASRIWNDVVLVTFLCAVLVEHGACDVQTCESALLTSCFPADVASSPKVKFGIYDVTVDSLKKDCTNADEISTCVNNLKIDGCQDEERRQLQLLKDGLRSTRNSLCHQDLYQSMVELNRCRNETIFDVCNGAYNDERTTLDEGGLLTRDERECRYGQYACYLKSAEACPSTSLAREAVKDVSNTNLDLNNCTRFDGSSGKQRCDAERYWGCFKMAKDRIRFPKVRDEQLLAEDCKPQIIRLFDMPQIAFFKTDVELWCARNRNFVIALVRTVSESVDSCTKYMEIEGCSDELKQRSQYLKNDFASLRSHLCDPNLYTSMLEWNQCLNRSALDSCANLQPHDHCSLGEYNCFLNTTTRCTRDSPAMKAVHHSFNFHLDLKNCSRIDGNSGITTGPKVLLTLAALCISLFPLRK